MSEPRDTLVRLCALQGVAVDYYDITGRHHQASDASLAAILMQLGVDAASPERAAQAERDLHELRGRATLPPVLMIAAGRGDWGLEIRIPEPLRGAALDWRIVEENAARHEGSLPGGEAAGAATRWLSPGIALPEGYHRLEVALGEQPLGPCALIAAPPQGWRPAQVDRGARLWGIAVQIYSLRSRRNWGIGDFGDLAALIEIAAARGASAIGLNPLHAMFDHDPSRFSPYSPSSRAALNTLYLDVEAIEDFPECDAARQLVGSAAFQSRLEALREAPLVDYPGVAAAKSEALALLYANFRERHAGADSPRAREFREFLDRGGEALARHARYEALHAHFNGGGSPAWGWQSWPAAFRDPGSEAVARFACEHPAQVGYFEYLQWQTALQLARAEARCEALGMAVGLYLDMAVSVDRGGSDVWGHQDCYAPEIDVGAPPDDLGPEGQKWGLPPLRPDRLRESAYLPLREALAACMAQGHALRIDHVMGLARLFWVPSSGTAADGAYVHYPLEETFSVVALESHRNRCMVIGEDLGTVPDSVREAMARYRLLSYRLLYFERDHGAEFRPPEHYPRDALVAVTTHDLPTLAGWWAGADIEVRRALGLATDEGRIAAQHAERRADRERLVRALARTNLLPEGIGDGIPERLEAPLSAAVHSYAACAPSVLMMAQIEDMLGVTEQANLPGTVDAHPNWRRRLPVTIESLAGHRGFELHAAALSRIRPRPDPAE